MQDFDSFYRAQRTDAVRWASALVGNRAIGEELAQETMAAMVDRFTSLDNPGGYLRRSIVNRAASWHRAAARERARIEKVTSRTPTVWTQPTNEVLGVLTTLPYKQRAALTLRYWADWSDRQIAEALECADATVRVLLHRGLATMRKELSP